MIGIVHRKYERTVNFAGDFRLNNRGAGVDWHARPGTLPCLDRPCREET